MCGGGIESSREVAKGTRFTYRTFSVTGIFKGRTIRVKHFSGERSTTRKPGKHQSYLTMHRRPCKSILGNPQVESGPPSRAARRQETANDMSQRSILTDRTAIVTVWLRSIIILTPVKGRAVAKKRKGRKMSHTVLKSSRKYKHWKLQFYFGNTSKTVFSK